jgi:hypothetical protein
MIRSGFLIPIVIFFSACERSPGPEVAGKKPVYISYDQLYQLAQLPPQPVVNAGKIMVYQQYLFMGEINRGIHIIDISDTLNPQKISFLKIPGTKDHSAQNNRLYTDNGPDLLVFNIENINNIILVQRKQGYFMPSEYWPQDFSGYFECADYSKGWLIDWEDDMLEDPKCRR